MSSEHATLILDSVVQKYQRSTGPLHARGGYASHQWRRLLAGLYLLVRIRRNFSNLAGWTVTQPFCTRLTKATQFKIMQQVA